VKRTGTQSFFPAQSLRQPGRPSPQGAFGPVRRASPATNLLAVGRIRLRPGRALGEFMEPVAVKGGLDGEGERLRALALRDLLSELLRKGSLLARKEVELARAEARQDLRAEIRMAGGLGVAGVCALLAMELLLVALVLGLAESGVLPGWGAALVVAAIVLAVGAGAGAWGWAKRVRRPLDSTRRSLVEGVRWAKEQVA